VTGRRFWLLLGAICLVGLAIRVGYVFEYKQDKGSCATIGPPQLCGDAFVYHEGANLLADGQGFVGPADYLYLGNSRASADHPPLYILYLAAFSKLGMRSVLSHQLASVILGVATLALTALFGRDMFSSRVGLGAAAVLAVYPYAWMNDGIVMSETIALTCTVGLVWTAMRLWRSPTLKSAAVFGVMGGVTALTRAELVLYVPIVAGLAALWAMRQIAWRQRIAMVLLVGAVCGAVMAPWVIRNLTTFKYPVTLSTGLGITLTYTNCDPVYHGDLIGYWYFGCIRPVPVGVDQSDDERMLRQRGLTYLKAHVARLPIVMAARVGRQWGLFKPRQMVSLDQLDNREPRFSKIGLLMYYAMVPLAVVGAVGTRRGGTALTPLLTVPAVITLTAAMTYGATRFRVPAELVLVVLATVGAWAMWDRYQPSGGDAGGTAAHVPGGSS
jgi:4-amino-4-deoxy-L-arabinose transferase-like glycosyltransferase